MSARSPAEMSCDQYGGAGPSIEDVACVIVSYRPDVVQLAHLCANVLKDGAKVIVVDNTEAPGLTSEKLPAGCELIVLGN